MKLDPHFEDVARDCIQLAHEQKSLICDLDCSLWPENGCTRRCTTVGLTFGAENRTLAITAGSRADMEDLQYYLDYGNTLADAASNGGPPLRVSLG